MSEIWMDVDTALASVPANIMPLIDDTDFKTIEAAVTFDQAGLALFWNFTTTAGVTTVTAVTPTSAGDYDWTDFTTSGMYGIEIPASGGASANNDTEGFGHFTGVATGILPWRGPKIGFRAAALNNLLVDDALSATRGLAGTALPAAAADAAGGLAISDLGGLDLDTKLANTNEITVARMGALTDWINGGRLDLLLDAIPTTAMRGTDSAALASVCTETRLQALTDWLDGGRLDLLLDAIPTTAMRGTDGANTVVPDAAGTAPTKEEIRIEMDANSIDLNAIIANQTTINTNVLANATLIGNLNNLSFNDIWVDNALPESYAAIGATFTPAQGMYMMWSDLRSPQQVGTVWTDFKLNNTTVSMTFSLDDATTPTKKTRTA